MCCNEPYIATFVIALTGGIASGKTAVSNAFAELGATIVDTDVIAREVVLPNSAGLKAITETFGLQVIQSDGSLDRKTLRNIIFSYPAKRRLLESILHPLIRAESIRQLQLVDTPLAFLVIPLLVEDKEDSNSYQWVDRILVVDVDETTQIKRVVSRDGITESQALEILQSQASRKQRLAVADDVIINNSNLKELSNEVNQLYNFYKQLSN